MENRKGTHLGIEGRKMVLNAVNFFSKEKDNGGPLSSILAVQQRTADCLQVGRSTVQRVCELQNNGQEDRSRTRKSFKSRDVPDAVKTEVRNLIYCMYEKKIRITLDTLSQHIEQKQIWEFKRTSLWKLVKDLGFRFKKTNHRVGLCEQSHVVSLRIKFLSEFIKNLDSVTPLKTYFLDETWIFSKGKSKHKFVVI